MAKDGAGMHVLVTGATSGIGYELARVFAENGYNLIIVARMEERLREVQSELSSLGVEVMAIQEDLFDPHAAMRIYDQVKARGITVNILVNDAGQGEWGKFTELDLQRQLDIIQLNVSSLVSLTYIFLKDMLARNEGRILQLGSIVSRMPAPFSAVYSGTKAFILFFTHSIINEIEDSDVTLTVLMPGATDTDFFRKAGAEESTVYSEGTLADPAKVARDGYDALMSGKSSVVSGFRNKFQGLLSDIMPMQAAAAQSRMQHKPTDKPVDERRTSSDHDASLREREADEQ